MRRREGCGHKRAIGATAIAAAGARSGPERLPVTPAADTYWP